MKPKDTINKRFILAESNSLVIETIQTESNSLRQRLRILKLKGTWRANDYNELVFEVALRKGPAQTYTFKGSWKINQNQQIEYITSDGKDTLTFKGYWQLNSANRLVYILEGNSNSSFEFRVGLESPTLYPKEGQIRYRIGIGAKENRLRRPNQILILYGEWKFSRNLGLSFQMNYGQGKIKEIRFAAEVVFKRASLELSLRSEKGQPLGITITYSFKLLCALQPEAFIRLKSLRKQLGFEAGFTLPF